MPHTTPRPTALETCRAELAAAQEDVERARRAQRAAEDRYHRVLASARMTTWEWTATGTCRLEGTSLPGTAVGAPMDHDAFLARVHPDDRERVRAAVHDALARPHPYVFDFRVCTEDDGIRWMQAHGDAFLDPEGIPRTTGVLVDVTAQVEATLAHTRLTEDLERQVAERTHAIAASNRELEAFAWSISHDLRSPLRAIDGFSALLEEDAAETLDPAARHHLARIRAAVRRMEELIDDLLMLSRVTRSELTVTDVDLTRLAGEVVAGLRAKPERVEQEGPAPSVRVELQPDMRVRGDARLLRIVLENLLGNAWKFTRARPDARIEVEQDPDGTVRIGDNGAGFDMGQRHRLFVPFQRLHAPQPYEGSGIGLAIVQRIVARHGGEVGAESGPTGGAQFWFRLGNA
jgi:signal transduction histidine kinase